jgi:hypothetical protein
VTFAPTSVASFAGGVTVASSAAGSPHTAAFSGTGVAPTPTAPAAALSPAAVDFGMLPLNTTSPAKSVTLSNTGNAPLTITDLKIAGTNASDFSHTHNCPVGASLAAGSTCSISLRFVATAAGTRVASIVLTSNAPGSPGAELKGTGVVQAAALAQVGPTSILFRKTRVGRTSSERTIRIRNSGTTPLEISSAAITGDFTWRSECPATLAPGRQCEFNVRFKPTMPGLRTGEFALASNAAGAPHLVKLSGQAVAAGSRDDDECDDEDECSQSVLPFFGRSR